MTRPSIRAALGGALAVTAVGAAVAVLVAHEGTAHPAEQPGTSGASQASDPHRAAIRLAETTLRAAPIRPGATAIDHAPLRELDQPSSEPGAQHVMRTRFWTAPGTVTELLAYLTQHPPAGLPESGGGSTSGPGRPEVRDLEFGSGDRTLQYTVVAYRGGVAVRADVQVLWAPARSPADRVPASATSVEVVIVRRYPADEPRVPRGAPTVRRTLTGSAARDLAAYVNQVPHAVPMGPSSCPAVLAGVTSSDTLTFRGPGPTAQVVVDLVGCGSTTFQVGSRVPIQLSRSYVVRGGLGVVITTAVGLPAGYGDR